MPFRFLLLLLLPLSPPWRKSLATRRWVECAYITSTKVHTFVSGVYLRIQKFGFYPTHWSWVPPDVIMSRALLHPKKHLLSRFGQGTTMEICGNHRRDSWKVLDEILIRIHHKRVMFCLIRAVKEGSANPDHLISYILHVWLPRPTLNQILTGKTP